MSEILLLASLVGLIFLIFLLNLIMVGVDHDIRKDGREPDDKSGSSDNKKAHASSETLIPTITDAIHTYRTRPPLR